MSEVSDLIFLALLSKGANPWIAKLWMNGVADVEFFVAGVSLPTGYITPDIGEPDIGE